jgi:hypothetical protein
MTTRNTPDMRRPASEIDDPRLLFERIGYRLYRGWLKGEGLADFYSSWNLSELRRVAALRGEEPPASQRDGHR